MKRHKFFTVFAALLIFVSASSFALGQRTVSGSDALAVRTEVNPGMELLAIMMWLAEKYPAPKDSRYKLAVWGHFSKYRKHPSITAMRKLQFYTDFTENGLLMSGFPDLRTEIPEQNAWFRIMGGKENFVSAMDGAKVFARDTGFWKFFQKHRSDYARWSDGLATEVQTLRLLPQVSELLRYSTEHRPPAVTIYLEPLNNWGAHNIDAERLAGKQDRSQVRFQVGPANDAEFLDEDLSFKLNNVNTRTIWHESLHGFLSHVLERNGGEVDRLERLFDAKDERLIRQNIRTWRYAFEENLVRSMVAVLTRERFGEEAYKKEIAGQVSNGFTLVPDIAAMIENEYRKQPETFRTFDEFLPEMLTRLEARK